MYIAQVKTLKGDKTYIEHRSTVEEIKQLQHETTTVGYKAPDGTQHKPYTVYVVCPQLVR